MVRFPHPFKVYKISVTGNPPIATETVICEGMGNAQSALGGGMNNETEAMMYDWVLYHKELVTEEIKAEYRVEADIYGAMLIGTVKKSMEGQLTKRIWFNNISD